MALTNKPKPLNLAYMIGLIAAPVLHGIETAAQTFKKGAPLINTDAAGTMTESTSPIDASAVGKRTLGLALNDATGVTSKDIPFAVAGEHTVFEGTLSDATAGTHTLAQADVWETFPLVKDGTFSTGNWYIDANAEADAGGALIVGLKDPVGTVDGRVFFIITTPARGTSSPGSANI
jgi:hypothetical protein